MGTKRTLRLSSLPANLNEKDYFSEPAILDRIKIPWRKIKEYLSNLANFEFLSIISQQDIITV